MSQSPLEYDGQGQQDYIAAWRALYEQVDAGSSWSGRERHRCFLNVGADRFANVSAVSGIDFADDGRGLAMVDWDNDGDLDLWFTNRTGPTLRFLSNRGTPGHHFLQLRLVGSSCNRDAIGARVEVVRAGADKPAMIKSLRAENGFRTQSTKWLHFGLGDAVEIERLVVRWPGGDEEEFSPLSVDARFVLKQGTGIAQIDPAVPSPHLVPSKMVVPAPTEQARIVLASRVPMPGLQYETQEGLPRKVQTPGGAPLLVNLWASWCPLCMKELRDFTAAEEQLREAGLEILALNVDHLGSAELAQPNDAVAALESLAFPFESGLATDELFAKLTLLVEHLVPRRQPLPAPCSFLVDPQGWLVAVYKGPVTVDQLQHDVAMAYLDRGAVRDLGIPFRGRWLFPRTYPNLLGLANKFREEGYEEDYLLYRQAEVTLLDAVPNPAEQKRARVQARSLAVEYNERGGQFANRGQLEQALAALREAVRLDPEFAEAYNNLGTVLTAQGRLDEAVRNFRQALTIRPDFVDASRNLKAVLGQIEQTR